MKRRYLNKESLAEAAQLLQPVTPTDKEHKAEWYNEPVGAEIIDAQRTFLTVFKKALVDCKSLKEVSELIEKKYFPNWPILDNGYFWISGFGKVIRDEWFARFKKFIDFVNTLE